MKIFSKIKKNNLIKTLVQAYRSVYYPTYRYYSNKLPFKILNAQRTIDYIVKNKVSVGRLGDGELNIMFNRRSIGFQEYTPSLSQDLRQLKNTSHFCLALPHSLQNSRDDKFLIKTFWWAYLTRNYKYFNCDFFTKNKIYLDTNFTRIVTEKKNKDFISLLLKKIDKIWENRNVIIIEGAETRFGVGNQLLRNTKSIKRIVVPAVNAYSKKDEIKAEAKKVIKNTLEPIVIVCLGPTATVLAYELSEDAQILDMGHFDLQYEYLKRGFYHPVKVADRYDNEMVNGNIVADEKNKKYLSEIEVDLS